MRAQIVALALLVAAGGHAVAEGPDAYLDRQCRHAISQREYAFTDLETAIAAYGTCLKGYSAQGCESEFRELEGARHQLAAMMDEAEGACLQSPIMPAVMPRP